MPGWATALMTSRVAMNTVVSPKFKCVLKFKHFFGLFHVYFNPCFKYFPRVLGQNPKELFSADIKIQEGVENGLQRIHTL